MSERVKKFNWIKYKADGEKVGGQTEFAQTHAEQANKHAEKPIYDFVEGEGIQRQAALELVNRWNKTDRYCYFI